MQIGFESLCQLDLRVYANSVLELMQTGFEGYANRGLRVYANII